MTVAEAPPPAANPLLLGHEAAEAAFLAAWRSGRLGHAWLIEGPRGVGKATLAFRLARALLAGPAETPACHYPAHPVFRMVAHGSHPDLQVLSLPVDPKNGRRKGEIVVGAARAASEALRSTSARGGARVLVVDAADDLNRNAANTLLKLLEEPPHGVVMLLVAQRVGFVPVTIASRCARLRLRPLAKPLLLDALRSLAPSLAPEKAEGLAALAEGSPGRALQLARSGWLENYAALLTTLAGQDADLSRALAAAEALVRVHQSEGAAVACALLGEVLRRVARLSAGAPLPPPLFEEEARALECLVTRVSLDRVLALWDKLAALAGRLESLNLDPLQTFLPIVEAVTGGRASGAAPAPA